MRRFFLVLFGWAFVGLTVSFAQGIKPLETTVGIVYDRERAFNARIGSQRSMMVGLEFGRLRTYYRTTYYYAGLGLLHGVKEQRQSPDPSLNRTFRPYAFGKQHSLLVLRGGWGVKRYYSEKARTKGVAVGTSYAFGPTLGLLKPYYLALRRSDPDNPGSFRVVHEKYSERNASAFTDNTRILGASSFLRGFSEIGLLPGGSASAAVHLDWGAFDEFMRAIEIGVSVDMFARSAPIMIDAQANSPLFITFFVQAQLGKRE